MLTRFFSIICLFSISSGALISCAGSKSGPDAPRVNAEYDAATGTWVPSTRVVVPQPAQDTPPIADPNKKQKEGVLTKVGKWMPWHKEEAKPAPTAQPQAGAPN